ncbi:hypothetical protein GQ55_8G202200 [Panicum hallii var. hallii]|uniref:Agenet domain-containing protein n=1 Tax=Panicum hallii var. hallii TaxID=1504633 RepID=A0A2T7CPB8_9POAL|nr:hypothetical protein GQ55_8G202200 [Panicum hallii var. hallii]
MAYRRSLEARPVSTAPKNPNSPWPPAARRRSPASSAAPGARRSAPRPPPQPQRRPLPRSRRHCRLHCPPAPRSRSASTTPASTTPGSRPPWSASIPSVATPPPPATSSPTPTDGGAAPAESVAASHVRPRPPSPSPSPRRFRQHDVVEAFHRRGWWSGVVFPSPAAAKSVTVAFPITREVITVPPHYVRPRRDYVAGEWVPSQTAVAVQPARSVRVYEAGEKVEAVRDREPYGSSWFPATVAKAVDQLSYIVEYSDEEEEGDKVMEYLHWQCIRAAADRHRAREDGFQIAPGSAVEAYCDGAWSPRVVRGMSGEGEYEVIVNGKEAEQVVIKVLELLRPRHEWDGSHWSVVSTESQANLRWHSSSGKHPSSPVEVTSSDDEHSHNPKNSAIKKAKKEPQLLQMVLAVGSEHASVSKVDSSLPALLSKLSASNHSPSSCLLSGYSTPPDKSMPTISENPVNEDTLSNMMLPGNQSRKTNPIEAFKGNNDSSDNIRLIKVQVGRLLRI